MAGIEIFLICQNILEDRNRTRFNRVHFLCTEYRVHVIARGELAGAATANAVSVRRFPASLASVLFFCLALFRVVRLMTQSRTIVYTTYEPVNLLIGYACKMLGSCWVADLWDDPEKRLMIAMALERTFKNRALALARRMELLIPRLVLRKADLCFTLMKREVMEKYRVREGRIRAVTNGVNLDLHYPEGVGGHEGFVLTYVGPLERVRVKDIPRLMERLFQMIGGFRIYLIGPDVKGGTAWLKERLRHLDPAVEISVTGRLPHDEVLRVLARTDVSLCLYPNEADLNPAYPIKLFESMVMGKPVVATKLRGISEVLTDGVDGFLVEPGDVDQAAAVIARLKADPELRRAVGERARDRAHDFDWKRIHARIRAELDAFAACEMEGAHRSE